MQLIQVQKSAPVFGAGFSILKGCLVFFDNDFNNLLKGLIATPETLPSEKSYLRNLN